MLEAGRVRLLGCRVMLEGGVVFVEVRVCRRGVWCMGLGACCPDMAGGGFCLGVGSGLDKVVKLLGTSWVVSMDCLAITVCEFCDRCECIGAEALESNNNSSFRMPGGIWSTKTGVGGNSTAKGSDVTENESETSDDRIEAGDPKIRLARGVELVLLAPSVWRRRSAMRARNLGSMGFLYSGRFRVPTMCGFGAITIALDEIYPRILLARADKLGDYTYNGEGIKRRNRV